MKYATKLVIAHLQTFAASGFTMEETAIEIGESYSYVACFARRHNLKFLRSGCSKADDRSRDMAASYKTGQTLLEIAGRYDLTRERVRQIISKHHNLSAKHGGGMVRAKKRRIISQAKRDASSIKRWGCTYSQYAMLRQLKTPTRAYSQQRNNANHRGIEWKLTLWEWWTVWQESGHWEERGRKLGQYGMCRYGDSGPYAIGNVYIATCTQNIQDYYAFARQSEAA